MLTQLLTGKSPAEAAMIARSVAGMLMEGRTPDDELGDLAALEGVARFPARVKCALLCWNVLKQALVIETRESALGETT